MASILFRTGSGTITSSLITGSPRFPVPVRHSSLSSFEKFEFLPKNTLRIRRAISESQTSFKLLSVNRSSQTFPEMLPEMEEDPFTADDHEDVIGTINASLKFAEKCLDRMIEMPTGFGNGSGRGNDGFGSGGSSDSGRNDHNNEQNKIGAHYKKLLESNPNDPLVLRNYGKFLHEIEGDTMKAEECYGRAILASPGDGELLSLYGKLIWDAHRDGDRAQCYFDQAISASPDDCVVMGSYAQFMWEAEEEDEDIDEEFGSKACGTSEIMVGAF